MFLEGKVLLSSKIFHRDLLNFSKISENWRINLPFNAKSLKLAILVFSF